MRLSAFLEALDPTCFAGGNRVAPKQIQKFEISQLGITGLKKHHKVAASSSQPWRGGDLKRLAFSLAGALELATTL
jgi:hypothetical protein